MVAVPTVSASMTRQRDLFPQRPAPRATAEPFDFEAAADLDPRLVPDPDYKPPVELQFPWLDYDPGEKR